LDEEFPHVSFIICVLPARNRPSRDPAIYW
jgi:hypothetical protein